MTTETEERVDPLKADLVSEPFTVKVDHDQDQPTVYATICVTDPTAVTSWMEENKRVPHVLYVLWKDGQERQRFVAEHPEDIVPMQIRSTGDFVLEAMLIWPTERRVGFGSIKSMLLRKSGSGYRYGTHDDVFTDDYEGERHIFDKPGYTITKLMHRDTVAGETWYSSNTFSVQVSDHSSVVSFNVSGDHFAPEPRDVTKRWVGLFFVGKTRDQCGFRKKMVWSVPLTLFWLIPQYVIKMVALLVSTIGGFVYRTDYRNAWKWGSYGGFEQTFKYTVWGKSAWFWRKSTSDDETTDDYVMRNRWFCLAVGFVGLVLVFTLFALMGGAGLLAALIWCTIIVSAMFALVAALAGLAAWATGESSKDRRDAAAARRREVRVKNATTALDGMSCDRGVRDRVENSTSLRIKFWRKKDTVCRPFSDG